MLLLPVLPQACFYRWSGVFRRVGCRDLSEHLMSDSKLSDAKIRRLKRKEQEGSRQLYFSILRIVPLCLFVTSSNSGVEREDARLAVTIGGRAPGVGNYRYGLSVFAGFEVVKEKINIAWR